MIHESMGVRQIRCGKCLKEYWREVYSTDDFQSLGQFHQFCRVFCCPYCDFAWIISIWLTNYKKWIFMIILSNMQELVMSRSSLFSFGRIVQRGQSISGDKRSMYTMHQDTYYSKINLSEWQSILKGNR